MVLSRRLATGSKKFQKHKILVLILTIIINKQEKPKNNV